MDQYFQFLLLGLGTGAVYAGLSLGIVLAYQGSGVINFAHGAMAMYIAFVYDELRDSGDYVLPFIGLPARIGLGAGAGLSFWPAFGLALLTAVGLGYLVHLLVFNPLRRAPMLAKVVAAVGLMLVIRAIAELRFDTNRIVDVVLPGERTEILGVVIARDRLWLAAVVIGLTVVLWSLYRFTTFGLATRAAATEEKGAILLGFSPSRLAAGNWMLASVVAGIVGILAAPITTVNASNFVLFVVPALACALL
ncbi:MAG: branched-chain amino acid ABC transporter permease, partial [Acidimicrobiia bacterium]|nr:branched-chain amino acid ABC transporter permease [Acidimicrobiia bacterium]